jgi:hypothetical protein
MSMRRFGTTTRRPRAARALVAAATLALLAPALAACDSGAVAEQVTPGEQEETTPAVPPLKVRTNVPRDGVRVDRQVKLTAAGGKLRSVKVISAAGPLPGKLSKDKTKWVASGRLEPGVAYKIHTTGVRSDGKKVVKDQRFRTDDLTLDEQTYPSVAPLQGETVGVGMPVVVTFDIPVTNKASIEKHMSVTSTPRQPGAWHWLSDQEVHWRPKSYWKAGSSVDVDVDINSIPAGAGIFGQESRHVSFDVGDAHVYKVNMDTHQMRVFSNGSLLRTIPITTGDGRHRPQQPRRLRHRRRRVRHARHLLRRVRPRRPVVGRRPGLGQRQPRLHRHEHRQRRLALQHDHPRRRGRVHRHEPADGAHQRVRRLEPRLPRLGRRLRPQLTAHFPAVIRDDRAVDDVHWAARTSLTARGDTAASTGLWMTADGRTRSGARCANATEADSEPSGSGPARRHRPLW